MTRMLIPAVLLLSIANLSGQRTPPPLLGRWDLTVQGPNGPFPSWLEVKLSGYTTLVGSFVGRTGSARPVSKIDFDGTRFQFSLPIQWERERNGKDLLLEGRLAGDKLEGTFLAADGSKLPFTGVRAPALKRSAEPRWGAPLALFNGKDLTGWKPRDSSKPNGWIVKDGVLTNAKPGNDLLSERKFDDFQLDLEFRYNQRGNSGVYLRGRYEFQIEDSHGRDPEEHLAGSIYGFLAPRLNAAKPAGEWQTARVTLVGRRVTIVLNGETVVDRQEIPGITGGALDSNEGEPGPLMLQGDHEFVEFRKVEIRAAI
jgi:hypothetical protein